MQRLLKDSALPLEKSLQNFDLKRLPAKAALIGGYLGKGDAFDKAIEAFSVAYADQNDEDYGALKRAIKSGKLKAVIEEPKCDCRPPRPVDPPDTKMPATMWVFLFVTFDDNAAAVILNVVDRH